MKTHLLIRTTIFFVLIFVSTGRADTVTEWNVAALNAIRAHRTPPPIASRQLAILHAAIYDAVNGISRTHEPYFVLSAVPASASKEAAASAAARKVLGSFYPAAGADFDSLHRAVLAAIQDHPQKSRGLAWGEAVANEILVGRATDGSRCGCSAANGEWTRGLGSDGSGVCALSVAAVGLRHAFRDDWPPAVSPARAARTRKQKVRGRLQ